MAVMCQSCGAELATWTGKCPECGGGAQVELKQKQDPLVGKVVAGRYKIDRKLGQGGMGTVYLAEHTGVGQRVAIKFLNPSFSGDADVVRRFLNEARSYGQISHPHAVQLHDFGQDDEGNLYISMEYIEGVDLKRTLEQLGRLPVKDALDVVLQVADVLGHAHGKGIIHRDLKPENVMLVKGLRGFHAKVLDFGVARLMAERTRVTAAGSICGTPRYMSPEQAEGGEVDHRADVYALGLVLFECLTGQHPFVAQTITETLRKQVMLPMPHLSEMAPDLSFPPGLDEVIQKAVAKRCSARFATMAELAQALMALVPTSAGDAVAAPGSLAPRAMEKTAHRSSPYTRPAAAAPSRRGPLIAAGGAALALVAAGVLWATRPPPPPQVIEVPVPVVAVPEPKIEIPQDPKTVPEPPKATPPQASTRPSDPAPTPDPRPRTVPSAAQQKVESNAAQGAADMAIYSQAHADFLGGRLQVARKILQGISAQSPAHANVVELEKQIDELGRLMADADEQYKLGNCKKAVELYTKAVTLNSGVQGAAEGIAKCRKQMPSGIAE